MQPRRPIRIAAQIHPQHGSYQGFRSAVATAEELGYDLIYNWDHFHPLYGDPDGPHFECWTTLAAIAEQTRRPEVGALVTSISYRNPDLLADMARTVDHISGGRLVLGLGSGWFRRDYDAYGYDFGTARSRLADLEAALPRIRARWERLNPPPTRRIPIVIGGVGEQVTLRLVAEHADGWHAAFPDHAADLEPKVAALRRWCEPAGRHAEDIEWGLGVEPDDIGRFLTDEAPACVAMGFTQFTLGFTGPDWDVAAGAGWLRWRDAVNDGRSVGVSST